MTCEKCREYSDIENLSSVCHTHPAVRFVTAQTGGNIRFNLRFPQGVPANLNEGI
jgi:hypothetical protein